MNLFSQPVLYCISDQANGDPLELFRVAIDCAVPFFQYRHKYLSEAERHISLARLANLPRNRTRLLINQSINLVQAFDADGVHLPGYGFHVEAARAELPGKLIGVSAHTLNEAGRAADAGAHYLLLAPVFTPISKPSNRQPLGIEGLRVVCRAVHVPVIALGGISAKSFREIMETGAAGIAGISLFADYERIPEVVSCFRTAVEGGDRLGARG
ncbi:MAG TPA: thiamine phosphate synthase [Acidobacteriota bacterium]|nr:thiamine phosphate synthase [Acidobacteriota bacterium]